MIIWDDEKKDFEDDMDLIPINMDNLENGLSIADKLLSVARTISGSRTHKVNVMKTSVYVQSLLEETKQKNSILFTIIELRKMDKLSEEEFKIMMLAYTSCSKF